MNRRACILAVTALTLVSGVSMNARADTSAQKADALFREGRLLMDHGHYAEARVKLEQSERTDRGIGTLFNIADCDEHLGLIATAWSEFNDVVTESRSSHQPARVAIAEARAATLLPRLPRLIIEGDAPPGANVIKDGASVSVTDIGKALPVDPGAHTVRVMRGSSVVLEKTVTVAEGTLARVNLSPPAENKPDPATTTLTSAPVFTPQPVVVTTSDPSHETHASRAPVQKILGGVLAGAGIATLGVGTYFGLSSMQKRDDSRAHCVSNVCDPTGISLRNDALNAGNTSTVLFVVGAVATVSGAIVFFTAPRVQDETAHNSAPPHSRLASLAASPYAGPGGSGLVLSGAFQ